MMEFTSSSKRAKTPGGGNNTSINVSCLVDGCNADLGQCREYHRRHKVCELHSKTAKVTIGGREQRFCQQCSRFHALAEFDAGKRSCRKRLDGHNRRRRKPPQPDSPPTPTPTPTTTFLSNQQGGIARILSFNSPVQIEYLRRSPMVGCGLFKPGPEERSPIGGPILNNHQLPSLNYDLTRHHLSQLLDSASQPTPTAQPGGRDNHHHHFNFLQHPPPQLAAVSSNQYDRAGNSGALSLLSSSPLAHHTTSALIMPPIPHTWMHHDEEAMLSESSGYTTLQFQGMFHDDSNNNNA